MRSLALNWLSLNCFKELWGFNLTLVLDAYAEGNGSIDSYQEFSQNDLKGFRISKDTQEYLVIFNPTQNAKKCEINLDSLAHLYTNKSGESIEVNRIEEEIEPYNMIVVKIYN